MRTSSRFALGMVAAAFAAATQARADTFEHKRLRHKMIPLDQPRISCVKQAGAWLGTNRRDMTGEAHLPHGVHLQSWTDAKKDPKLGKETVFFDIQRRKEPNGTIEITEIKYTSETKRTTVYRPSATMRLQQDAQHKQLFITAFTGENDVWAFHIDLDGGIAIKTETLYGYATSIGAYECF